MTAALKPYSAYKDSGVPWLGKVPERWELRSFRSLASRISLRNQTAACAQRLHRLQRPRPAAQGRDASGQD